MIGSLAALHAPIGVWIALLVLGIVAMGIGAWRLWRPDKAPAVTEEGLGRYRVDTGKVAVDLSAGKEGYRDGASVWTPPWWAPWRPTIIHRDRTRTK